MGFADENDEEKKLLNLFFITLFDLWQNSSCLNIYTFTMSPDAYWFVFDWCSRTVVVATIGALLKKQNKPAIIFP